MKNILKGLGLLTLTLFFVGCPSDDVTELTPIKSHSEQYPIDLERIETFLETHYVTIDSDFNTTFTEIASGGTQTPVMNHPDLDFIEVERNDLTYKIYYLKLNQGDVSQVQPTKHDSVFVTYKGLVFEKSKKDANGNEVPEYTKQTVFEDIQNPVWFNLKNVIVGWGEIIPLFNPGNFTVDNTNGNVTYNNFGAAVMFLPSAFGYYSLSTGNIPSYAPLVFNFKLKRQRTNDDDGDKIPTKYEYVLNSSNVVIDSDGDGVADYQDKDDDNDGTKTRTEIAISVGLYYDFANIPLCSGTGSNGKKKHLDPSCQ